MICAWILTKQILLGTFQQLLQRVSTPNWNLQPMHQEITTTQLESSMGTNFRAHANHKQSGNNTNVKGMYPGFTFTRKLSLFYCFGQNICGVVINNWSMNI